VREFFVKRSSEKVQELEEKGLGGPIRIERIEIFVTDLPDRLQRQMSSGSWDTGVPGSVLGKPVFVKIYAEGVVGYGQIRPISPGHFVPETTHSMVAAITEIYGPRLIGWDLSGLDSMWTMFDRVLPANASARAVLDHAIHDALGKAYGVPVYALLGGLCQLRIPLEWSISMAEDASAMVRDALRAVEEFSVPVLCMKGGGPGGWRRDVENFSAIRKAVGEKTLLGVDANCGWHLSDAKRAIRAMAEHKVDYVEQPIARTDFGGLVALRKVMDGIPLMADESLVTLDDAYELARARAVDVFCIKLYKVGGLRRAKKIAAVAEVSGTRLNVGGLAAYSQLEAAAAAHFYASTPPEQMMPAAEFLFGVGAIGPDPLVAESDFVVKDGHVTPPSGPGLGIEIDEKRLVQHTLRRERVG
jgi:L-alanine-DL-glutamate epimerase-like enolase superfamily enzyme